MGLASGAPTTGEMLVVFGLGSGYGKLAFHLQKNATKLANQTPLAIAISLRLGVNMVNPELTAST